jgi:hypothetical protein
MIVDGDSEVGDLRKIGRRGEFETPNLIIHMSPIKTTNDDQPGVV